MEKLIGLLALVAAGLAALAAWSHSKKEKDVVVDNQRFRGAY